jgi:hypothetical protein
MTQSIKIFLASSSELVEDRRAFEIFISRQNDILIEKGVYLKLVIWENFLDAMSETRLQEEYNVAIRDCDLFILLFFTKVGKYSAEEFKVAYDTFKATGKPLIYTYFKDAQINIGAISDQILSLLNFKKQLSDMGHYYTTYKSTDGLLLHFSQQLDKLTEKGIIPSDDNSKKEPEMPTYKKGHVLYQIPKKMQMLKEATCQVRIAFEKILLTQDFDIDQDTEVESDIRVSDYMEVKIIDPAENAAFKIRTTNELIQYVGKDDYTEWRFYVKPILPGEHSLELKVSIILMINGREVKREKSFDESIFIVAEPVVEEPHFIKAMDVDMLPEEPEKEIEVPEAKPKMPAKKKKSRSSKGSKASKIYVPKPRSDKAIGKGGFGEEMDFSMDKMMGGSIQEEMSAGFDIEFDDFDFPEPAKVDLKSIKQRLKSLAASDLGAAFEELAVLLSPKSKLNKLLAKLKKQFDQSRKQEATGEVSATVSKKENDRILQALQLLINEIQEYDTRS